MSNELLKWLKLGENLFGLGVIAWIGIELAQDGRLWMLALFAVLLAASLRTITPIG